MTIGKRIATSFGVIMLLLIILGGLNYSGVSQIVTNAEEVIAGNKLDGLLAQREVDHLNWVSQVSALLTDDTVTKLNVETDHTKCGFGKWLYSPEREEAGQLVPSIADLLTEMEEPHKKLHESAIQISKSFKQADTNLPTQFTELEAAHLAWAGHVCSAMALGKKKLDVQTDPTQCGLGKWLTSPAARAVYDGGDGELKKLFNDISAPHNKLHSTAVQINALLATGTTGKALDIYEHETLPELKNVQHILSLLKEKAHQEVAGMQEANNIFARNTVPMLTKVQGLLKEIRTEAKAHVMTDDVMLSSALSTKIMVTIVAVMAILAGLVMGFLTTRGIVKVLSTISSNMADMATEVVGASNHVSRSSQTLAEGASEQAAALEETSSSLEEISSMTKNNVENARQANTLATEASVVVIKANDSMGELTVAMEEISQASEATSKIIKTIDEIAFQTNLLALNAAVEAARAGEAGAGFAVVADEVRNLAMRAAAAAKDTANLIEGTVKKVHGGNTLLAKTNENFTSVTESSSKIAQLVNEITMASEEQATGIGQINTATNEMDKAVQQTAASAEESASAAEELNAQAESMNAIVRDLAMLLGVTQDARTGRSSHPAPRQGGRAAPKALPQTTTTKPMSREKNPKKVIPFDDDNDDFEDF
ncbi:MAG: CZB domain-containing protein [Proteobacteria bacterium]|nr:CZB domain-containing protein [Pseudomonadota bacterium]MBU1641630.1 CZB domain-containing protein [Pseudomonadota bacterium]